METSLTSEISAIQIKLMYLHFKSVKINDSIRQNNNVQFENIESPEAIAHRGSLIYDIIDVITLFENYNSFVSDAMSTQYLSKKLNQKCREQLKEVNKVTQRWKHVRNKVGGHIDLNSIIEYCNRNNYKGIFLSNKLQADFKGVLLTQLLDAAFNSTLGKSKLFARRLDLMNPIDMRIFIGKFNQDWKICLDLFNPLFEDLYTIGKKEKLEVIDRSQIGIIKF
ncbi:MAG TPA: hypothetical protein VGA67_04860 [Candidatus Dojkabacteria bacterium]